MGSSEWLPPSEIQFGSRLSVLLRQPRRDVTKPPEISCHGGHVLWLRSDIQALSGLQEKLVQAIESRRHREP